MNKETNKQNDKTFLWWFITAVSCIIITNVYAIFGHGVRSNSMDYMFLYPLLGGAAPSFIEYLSEINLKEQWLRRLGRNILFAGIATLTSGAMLRGIFEIAGTSSNFTLVFFIVGWIMAIAGAIGWVLAYALRRD